MNHVPVQEVCKVQWTTFRYKKSVKYNEPVTTCRYKKSVKRNEPTDISGLNLKFKIRNQSLYIMDG